MLSKTTRGAERMKIWINGTKQISVETKHTLKEIAELMKNKAIEVCENNIIYWDKVFVVVKDD